VFRFTVTLPDAYPADDALPSVQFHTPLYHPLVHPEVGLACVELCDVLA
jgi:ubiquitin-protein ligase